jgi:excisionase family DNA binding protein
MMQEYRFERDGVPTVVLDVPEVAAYLAVTRDTVYRLIRGGQLPHVRIGKSIRVRVETLERFLEQRETTDWEAGASWDTDSSAEESVLETWDGRPVLSPTLWMPVSLLNTSVRSQNRLRTKRVKYVGELVGYTEQKLLTIPDFGRKLLQDVKKGLYEVGLSLGMRPDDFDPNDVELEARSRFAEECCRATGCNWLEAWTQFDGRELLTKGDGRLAPVIFELGLPSVTDRALLHRGIRRVGDLVQMTSRELEDIEGVGVTAMERIYLRLTKDGLTLGSTVPGWSRPQWQDSFAGVDDEG